MHVKGVWISAQLLPVLEKRPVKVGPNREKRRFFAIFEKLGGGNFIAPRRTVGFG